MLVKAKTLGGSEKNAWVSDVDVGMLRSLNSDWIFHNQPSCCVVETDHRYHQSVSKERYCTMMTVPVLVFVFVNISGARPGQVRMLDDI